MGELHLLEGENNDKGDDVISMMIWGARFFSFSFGGRTGVKEHSITVHFNHRRYSNSKILENTLLIHIYRKKREIKEETIKWFRNMPPKIRRGHEWNGNGPWSWTYGPNILYFPCFVKSKFKKYLWRMYRE